MPDSALTTARKEIRNHYGKTFAEKASDALVLRLARPVAFAAALPKAVLAGQAYLGARLAPAAFGAEAMAPAPVAAAPAASSAPQLAVIEMPSQPVPSVTPSKAALAALGESLKTLVPGELPAPLRAARKLQASALRDAFERAAAPIREELGRHVPRRRASGREQLTELCWLNESLRTLANIPAIALVAEHPSITHIGLPRLLLKEDFGTAKVLGVPAYRTKTGASGAGVIVALIDSEAASGHPALQGHVLQKQNYTKIPWGTPDDHGTAVAGILVSQDAKVSGIAPGATVYNYKVLAADQTFNADDFGGSLAIQQAIEDGADIANCSWGAGPAQDGKSREARACDAAWSLGLAIVKSAGNNGAQPGTLTTPADAEGVIVVGATDLLGQALQGYSSRGPTADGRNRPHLIAPGGSPGAGLTSCLVAGGFGDCGYGTSYAAPHVTGLLALLLEKDRSLGPDALRKALLALCHPLAGIPPAALGAGLPVLA